MAAWLRHLPFSSEPILYSYLQIVGSLLCFTFAANALVRFRGTHDRLTLILAFGFVLSGVVETVATFSFYDVLASSAFTQMRVPLPWMVSRTLLALVLIASLVVERRVPNSRDPGREMAIALVVVVGVAYMTSAAFFGSPLEPVMHPRALLSRPGDLLPAILYAIAAIGFGRRMRRHASPVDRAFCLALWMNVVCHVLATQSERLLDAPFTAAQFMKVGSYAIVLGGALLDNARLFEQVRLLAVTDPLTGLSNYRTLINVMETEMQRSRRTGRPFAILLLDLDGLKVINDQHGHLTGSRAICRLASVLRIHSRAMDTPARYGGDEFAVVLPEAGEEAAASVSRRICERLAKDGELPHITVSVGAAVFPRDGETIDTLFDAADRALYGMKRRPDGIRALSRIAACL
ncbi:MAG TPA: GGDEF domain-containing protein [Candidatus Acidoferrum sp.]|nr:GGDEF domain-containing protein [Candidatus Acidoferrum sp.]